ncbi:MAG: hypothetical protein K5893_04015 [Prevotella sp.]|nr:hypothetical protein [Prevotella sp.]
MKKYIIPHCEIVNVKLINSCLDDFNIGGQSTGGKPEDSLGKEHNILWEDDFDTEVSLWGDNDEEEDY